MPTAIVYNTKVSRPITPVYDLMKEEKLTDEGLRAAVNFLFEALTFRPPTLEESNNYLEIVKDSVQEVGRENGVFMGLSAIFLDRDALRGFGCVRVARTCARACPPIPLGFLTTDNRYSTDTRKRSVESVVSTDFRPYAFSTNYSLTNPQRLDA